jgi:hypothetical protein
LVIIGNNFNIKGMFTIRLNEQNLDLDDYSLERKSVVLDITQTIVYSGNIRTCLNWIYDNL